MKNDKIGSADDEKVGFANQDVALPISAPKNRKNKQKPISEADISDVGHAEGPQQALEVATRKKTRVGAKVLSKALKKAPVRSVERLGRDEMNLAEYAIASARRGSTRGAVIENIFEHRHRVTGKLMRAEWRVSGDAELGLPNPSDEQILLVMFELTRERGMPQQVTFSRGDLLRRLGWPHNQKHYKMLRDAFTRWHTVSIRTVNCFWDAEAKTYPTIGFHILAAYSIADEKSGPRKQGALELSHFTWSDEIYKSMRANYLKPLDLDFALSLDLPTALRLYRYLDKKRHGAPKVFPVGLRRLYELHLGLTPCAHNSQMKQRLSPAHAELIARGYLARVQYMPMKTKDGEKVLYTFGTALKPKSEHKTERAAPVEESEADAPSKLEIALACHAVYLTLPNEERSTMLDEAKTRVPNLFWERLGNPGSPVSEALWEIVMRDHEEQVQDALCQHPNSNVLEALSTL